jgi:hypothetical protein
VSAAPYIPGVVTDVDRPVYRIHSPIHLAGSFMQRSTPWAAMRPSKCAGPATCQMAARCQLGSLCLSCLAWRWWTLEARGPAHTYHASCPVSGGWSVDV